MSRSPLRQMFTAPGIVAWLACHDGSCLFELTVQRSTQWLARLARLEILLQPRDPAGLSNGPAVALYDHELPLHPLPDHQRLAGSVWLPRTLSPSLLGECYFRIQPGTMAADVDNERGRRHGQ